MYMCFSSWPGKLAQGGRTEYYGVILGNTRGTRMPLTRISLTIPVSLLQQLDAHAQAGERARSRVVVEAVRAYLGRTVGTEGTGRTATARVAEEPTAPYTAWPGLGEHRLQQLEADLRLSPTERVLAAQDMLRLYRPRRPPTPNRVVQF